MKISQELKGALEKALKDEQLDSNEKSTIKEFLIKNEKGKISAEDIISLVSKLFTISKFLAQFL